MRKGLLFVLSLVFSLAVGCGNSGSTTYKPETVERVNQLVAVAFMGNENPQEWQSVITAASDEVLASLAEAKISDAKVGKLLGLMEADFEAYPDMVDAFYGTGITNKEIANFTWALVKGGNKIVQAMPNSAFADMEMPKATILAEYNAAVAAITEADFKKVLVATLDYAEFSLNRNPIIFVGEDLSEITRADVKVLAGEYRAMVNKFADIFDSSTMNAAGRLVKALVGVFMPMEAAEKQAFDQAIDSVLEVYQIYVKALKAVVNVVNDAAIDAVYNAMESQDPEQLPKVVTILAGKMIYAATNNTGLTAELLAEYMMLYAGMTELEIPTGFDEVLSQLITDSAAFKNLNFNSNLPADNMIVEMVSAIMSDGISIVY